MRIARVKYKATSWLGVVDISAETIQLVANAQDEIDPAIDLIFNIPSIIATASASMLLSPGDIIATGTPVGVGIGFDPPKFLQPGDVVKVTISDIGTIENVVV